MERYGPETYGEGIADLYDAWYSGMDPLYVLHPSVLDLTDAVDLLASLADEGPNRRVLELAIGTGRVAIPLAERGFDMYGIDVSDEMVKRLQAKTGGGKINVTLGDMVDMAVATDEPFSLVFGVLDALSVLLTQEDQVRCLTNVAHQLAPGGRFVLESKVPHPTQFDHGQTVYVNQIALDQVHLVAAHHSQVGQRIELQHVLLSNEGVRLVPVSIRYVWPAELDLMARLAGLEMRHRWGGWRQEPFDDTCHYHISVYEKP